MGSNENAEGWIHGLDSALRHQGLKPSRACGVCGCKSYTGQAGIYWWVSKVLRRRNKIISKVKSKYWRTTQKFGIQFPKTVQESLSIYKEVGNDYWEKALNKDMSKVKVAWQHVNEVTPDQAIAVLVKDVTGHQDIKFLIIFDIRTEFQ